MSLTLTLVAIALLRQDGPEPRTPAIYRCPAPEAESEFFERLVTDYAFDTFCIEPKPGPNAQKVAAGPVKIKFIPASAIDTPANLKWRNLTIEFANGRISPKAWLNGTKNLKETVHFLANPKTSGLRQATNSVSSRAVFIETLLLTWPGKPCLTADETSRTRELPDAGALQSWLLAMNDHLGPLLYLRADQPYIVTQAPTIVRADDKPGLLIFRQQSGKHTKIFYFNNGPGALDVPGFDSDHVNLDRGLLIEDTHKAKLMSQGSFMESYGDE